LIEPYHRLAINESHGRALKSGLKQFLQRILIGANILLDE
jgi:hypothetical protein